MIITDQDQQSEGDHHHQQQVHTHPPAWFGHQRRRQTLHHRQLLPQDLSGVRDSQVCEGGGGDQQCVQCQRYPGG